MANYSNASRPKEASFIKIRFAVTLLAVLCPIVCYIGRQNLSMAIVSMVDGPHSSNDESSTTTTTTTTTTRSHPIPHIHPNQIVPYEKNVTTMDLSRPPSESIEPSPIVTYGSKYPWSPSEKGLVLETFFWFYTLCQIPGARVAETFGARWILFLAAAGTAVLNLLMPLAASCHVWAFAGARALLGICQAALYPACYVLFTVWLPPSERSLGLPILGVGAYIGSIITTTAAGYFAEQAAFGWEYAFYMPGVMAALWCIGWLFVGRSEPRDHKLISLEEIDYIEARMEVKRLPGSTASEPVKKSPNWTKIASSQAVWAFATSYLASNWAFAITFLLLPSYLNYVLLIPPFKNGLINSVIYGLFCISSPIVGSVSTLMIETRPFGLSRLHIRKLFQCGALFGQAICFAALPSIGPNTTVVLTVLYVQTVMYSLVNGGEVQLPSELSVDFAGTLYAIGNCVGSSTGFLVPRTHSMVVVDVSDAAQWNLYFYLAAGVTALGGLVFLIFGRNELHDFSLQSSESGEQDKIPPSNTDRYHLSSIGSYVLSDVELEKEKSKIFGRVGQV